MATRMAFAAAAAALLVGGCQVGQASGDWLPGRAGSAGMAGTDVEDVNLARENLARLTVAPAGSMDGYDRDAFGSGWAEDAEGCDTRATVLQRHGAGVRTNGYCTVTGGAWTGAWGGEPETDPAELDIDHVVPLGDAWRSGAAQWGDDQRGDFMNDAFNLAVTDSSLNRARGDHGPADWMPPHPSGKCRLAVEYTRIKELYDLTITPSDKSALDSALAHCPAT